MMHGGNSGQVLRRSNRLKPLPPVRKGRNLCGKCNSKYEYANVKNLAKHRRKCKGQKVPPLPAPQPNEHAMAPNDVEEFRLWQRQQQQPQPNKLSMSQDEVKEFNLWRLQKQNDALCAEQKHDQPLSQELVKFSSGPNEGADNNERNEDKLRRQRQLEALEAECKRDGGSDATSVLDLNPLLHYFVDASNNLVEVNIADFDKHGVFELRDAFKKMLDAFADRKDASKHSGDDDASRRLTFTRRMYRMSVKARFEDNKEIIQLQERATEILDKVEACGLLRRLTPKGVLADAAAKVRRKMPDQTKFTKIMGEWTLVQSGLNLASMASGVNIVVALLKTGSTENVYAKIFQLAMDYAPTIVSLPWVVHLLYFMVKDKIKESPFGLTWTGLNEYIKAASETVESGRISEYDEFYSEAVTQDFVTKISQFLSTSDSVGTFLGMYGFKTPMKDQVGIPVNFEHILEAMDRMLNVEEKRMVLDYINSRRKNHQWFIYKVTITDGEDTYYQDWLQYRINGAARWKIERVTTLASARQRRATAGMFAKAFGVIADEYDAYGSASPLRRFYRSLGQNADFVKKVEGLRGAKTAPPYLVADYGRLKKEFEDNLNAAPAPPLCDEDADMRRRLNNLRDAASPYPSHSSNGALMSGMNDAGDVSDISGFGLIGRDLSGDNNSVQRNAVPQIPAPAAAAQQVMLPPPPQHRLQQQYGAAAGGYLGGAQHAAYPAPPQQQQPQYGAAAGANLGGAQYAAPPPQQQQHQYGAAAGANLGGAQHLPPPQQQPRPQQYGAAVVGANLAGTQNAALPLQQQQYGAAAVGNLGGAQHLPPPQQQPWPQQYGAAVVGANLGGAQHLPPPQQQPLQQQYDATAVGANRGGAQQLPPPQQQQHQHGAAVVGANLGGAQHLPPPQQQPWPQQYGAAVVGANLGGAQHLPPPQQKPRQQQHRAAAGANRGGSHHLLPPQQQPRQQQYRSAPGANQKEQKEEKEEKEEKHPCDSVPRASGSKRRRSELSPEESPSMATLLTMFLAREEADREQRRAQEAHNAMVNKQLQLFAEVLTGQGQPKRQRVAESPVVAGGPAAPAVVGVAGNPAAAVAGVGAIAVAADNDGDAQMVPQPIVVPDEAAADDVVPQQQQPQVPQVMMPQQQQPQVLMPQPIVVPDVAAADAVVPQQQQPQVPQALVPPPPPPPIVAAAPRV